MAVRMAGSAAWSVLFLLGFPSVLAMPPNGDNGGVPLSAAVPQPRQDVPAEDFSNGFSHDFAQNLPTNEFMGSFQDVAAAKENSLGFIVGMPDSFPVFSSLGGFDSMPAADEGDKADSFVPEFRIPVVEIQDINDNQPQFELPQFTQQRQGSLTLYRDDLSDQKSKTKRKLVRTRRTAGEPIPEQEDQSTVPHVRVHRVQTDAQIPHRRNPREFQGIQDSQTAFSDIPYHVEPFPAFQFPRFQSERISASAISGRGNIPIGGRGNIPVAGRGNNPISRSSGGATRKVDVRTSDDDFIVPDSQRFYPTFNPRLPPSLPPPRQPFFPSSPPAPRTPGPRNGRFNGHGSGFRGSPSVRENGSFRDFHDTFYGPGAREAINRPDFAFPSSRRPSHREKEPLDNTLLGSGNFEVLRGGTFYDEDDPDLGFDHLLHEGYYGSHAGHNAPHSNNHVDDFFSNFRDFSEFAARRSDEGETSFDDSSFFGPGYASEIVHHVINSSHPDFKDAIANKESQDDQVKKDKVSKKADYSAQTKDTKSGITNKASNKRKYLKHRKPKNIQEVMEDLEAQPNESSSSSLVVDEADPMVAMF